MKGRIEMNWKAKRIIYKLSDFIDTHLLILTYVILGIMIIYIGLQGLLSIVNTFIEGKDTFEEIKYLPIIVFGIVSVVLLAIPQILFFIAKHDSYKNMPILKKINTITNSHITTTELINKIEEIYFSNKMKIYTNLSESLQQYEEEIEHIYTIFKNKKQFSPAMKEQAKKRVTAIINSIKYSIKMDQKQHEAVEKLEKEKIEKEWNNTYKINKYLFKQQIEETNPINEPKTYFKRFAQISHDYFISESFTSMRDEVEKLGEERLRIILSNILVSAIHSLRSISDVSMSSIHNDGAFHIALTWHLSDVIQNLPTHLFEELLLEDTQKHQLYLENRKQTMVNYVCEYLVFLKTLENPSNDIFIEKYRIVISRNHNNLEELNKYSSMLKLT